MWSLKHRALCKQRSSDSFQEKPRGWSSVSDLAILAHLQSVTVATAATTHKVPWGPVGHISVPVSPSQLFKWASPGSLGTATMTWGPCSSWAPELGRCRVGAADGQAGYGRIRLPALREALINHHGSKERSLLRTGGKPASRGPGCAIAKSG